MTMNWHKIRITICESESLLQNYVKYMVYRENKQKLIFSYFKLSVYTKFHFTL
jgi:hypothetical protein